MSGFKTSKDRLTLLLGVTATWTFRFNPVCFYHLPSPRALRIMLSLLCLCSISGKNKAQMTAHLFTTQFTEYLKSNVESYCSEKKIPFKILLFVDNAPSHPRALIEIYSEIHVVFMPGNTTSILQPMDQEVLLAFKYYYLRNTFYKAIYSVIPVIYLGRTIENLLERIHHSRCH